MNTVINFRHEYDTGATDYWFSVHLEESGVQLRCDRTLSYTKNKRGALRPDGVWSRPRVDMPEIKGVPACKKLPVSKEIKLRAVQALVQNVRVK